MILSPSMSLRSKMSDRRKARMKKSEKQNHVDRENTGVPAVTCGMKVMRMPHERATKRSREVGISLRLLYRVMLLRNFGTMVR